MNTQPILVAFAAIFLSAFATLRVTGEPTHRAVLPALCVPLALAALWAVCVLVFGADLQP